MNLSIPDAASAERTAHRDHLASLRAGGVDLDRIDDHVERLEAEQRGLEIRMARQRGRIAAAKQARRERLEAMVSEVLLGKLAAS